MERLQEAIMKIFKPNLTYCRNYSTYQRAIDAAQAEYDKLYKSDLWNEQDCLVIISACGKNNLRFIPVFKLKGQNLCYVSDLVQKGFCVIT